MFIKQPITKETIMRKSLLLLIAVAFCVFALSGGNAFSDNSPPIRGLRGPKTGDYAALHPRLFTNN